MKFATQPAKPLSRFSSHLRNARCCWYGSVQRPPSRRAMLAVVACSYSWPMGSRSPPLPRRLGSAVAMSINGCSGFWRKASRAWQTNPAAVPGACRAKLPCRSSTRSAHDAPARRGEHGIGLQIQRSFPSLPSGQRCKGDGNVSGLAMQLSQGQGRQPLAPEGAPPAAGVRLACSK